MGAQLLTNRHKLWIARAGVALAVFLSLWLRAGPAWHFVFTPWGVDFQEPDAWFHLRTAHNLLAHFPFRSGFDPYALFPGGMNMPTGPLWDYMIACSAWILGVGSPSAGLIDRVAAWLPAILGALCPIPVFWISRRLFGLTAGLFAALWIAVTPGEFLWLTHLGNADHHAAEGFFSLLTFCFYCVAADPPEARDGKADLFRILLPVLSGMSLGALLATQPAAIFVPGILVAVTMLDPSMARLTLWVFTAAAVTLLPVAENPYTAYDWLSLAVGASAVAAVWLLESLHLRKGWPSWSRWIAAAMAIAFALGITELSRPALIPSLLSGIHDLNTSTVAELQPVIVASRTAGKNITEMTFRLGIVWALSLPGLIGIAILAFRRRQSSLTSLAVFSVAFTIAAFLHWRMILYFVPFAGILAGAVCAWLLRFVSDIRVRFPLALTLAGAILALNIRPAIARMTFETAGAGQDWFEALAWLRDHSPEPFAEPALWNGYFPRRKGGEGPSLPVPSYGIATWWDTGYMIETLSHRIPMANGFGAGIGDNDADARTSDIAKFYASTFSDSAVNLLRKINARYVIVDPTIPVFPSMAGRSKLGNIEQAAGYDPENFYRLLWREENGDRKPLFVYFADYYQQMGIRLFLNDGEAVHGTGPIVLQIKNGGPHQDLVVGAQHFDSDRDAGDFITGHSDANLIIGCLNPRVSCFDVAAVSGLRRVFTSNPAPLSRKGEAMTVKIFEVEPAPPGGSQ